ncbi:DUF6000 family protein [Streptomyces sp. NPDC033538]|uniref:DUF6000 family protein n=1 Tax=Streptomyces sp. NPDC033538 TaxID=3155367 RepID=UPI0033FAFC54
MLAAPHLPTPVTGYEWHSRLTGAWLIGVDRRERVRERIGDLLLASEVTSGSMPWPASATTPATPLPSSTAGRTSTVTSPVLEPPVILSFPIASSRSWSTRSLQGTDREQRSTKEATGNTVEPRLSRRASCQTRSRMRSETTPSQWVLTAGFRVARGRRMTAPREG